MKRNPLLPTKKRPLCVVGVTLDGGKWLMGGVFAMHDTMGFTLTDSMWVCIGKPKEVSLPCFVADAIEAGWPAERAISKVREAFSDSGLKLEYPAVEFKLRKIALEWRDWTTRAKIEEYREVLDELWASDPRREISQP